MQHLFSMKVLLGLMVVVMAVLLAFELMSRDSGGLTPSPTPTEPKKIIIIEYLPFLKPTTQGFKQEMSRLGYQEGERVFYEEQSANFIIGKLDEIAADAVAKDPDLIFANTGEAAVAALKAARNAAKAHIPIVFVNTFDPIGLGLVQSLASSGNNTTGIINDMPLLQSKRLEFLKRISPDARNIGIVYSRITDPFQDASLAEFRKSAKSFDLALMEYRLESAPGPDAAEEMKSLLGKIKPGEIDALVRIGGPITGIPELQTIIAQNAKRLRVVSNSTNPEQGFIFEYTDNVFNRGQQAAQIADKILRGADPARIPVEFGKEYTLIINLKLANETGITIPNSVLQIANTVLR